MRSSIWKFHKNTIRKKSGTWQRKRDSKPLAWSRIPGDGLWMPFGKSRNDSKKSGLAMTSDSTIEKLLEHYGLVRQRTEDICSPLETEDYVVQPMADVSPPNWHLGHSTWFFETFVLLPHLKDYTVFDPNFNYVFNSYYETVGSRVSRTDRGNLSRPTVLDVYRYRHYVDHHIDKLFGHGGVEPALYELLELGVHHEQQHQELLFMDIKYI